MINTLLKYKCDMNNRLLFVDTGLTLSDIGNDGVHLADSGKAKLTRRVQCESLDFYRNVSSRHMWVQFLVQLQTLIILSIIVLHVVFNEQQIATQFQ